MAKKDKKSKPSVSKRESPQTPQSTRNISFGGTDRTVYNAVPGTDTDDQNAPLPQNSRERKKEKKKSKGKRKKDTDDDDDDDQAVLLERKPSPVIAPLPHLTKEEYEFFEMVRTADVDDVDNFLKSDAFAGMTINKADKTGYTILHYAVRRQDQDMVRLLIQQPGIKLYDTIYYAVREGNEEITKILLEKHDQEITEEQKKLFLSSTIGMGISQDSNISMMSNASGTNVAPLVSPTSARSGVISSVKLRNVVRTQRDRVVKVSKSKSKSKSNTDVNVVTSSVLHPDHADDEDESLDSEFPYTVTPLMIAAQQGCLPLMELFYSRNERLETEEFSHDVGCGCDICSKLDGDQDLTRTYQRVNLYRALVEPEYICFISRVEHKDPINYALNKILKIREIIKLDVAFHKMFDGLEEKLEEFVTKLIELCRNTTETEMLLSPKDTDERLPHLYPRLWYTVGLGLQKFVAAPNTQNIVYKIWATDDWPDWDTYSTKRRVFILLIRMILSPIIVIILYFTYCIENSHLGRALNAPVSRLMNYMGTYMYFMIFMGIQALYPYQRCTNNATTPQVDEDVCTIRGPPNLGYYTEYALIVFFVGFSLSIFKKQSVSWYWRVRWNWIELIGQLTLAATFICWAYAFVWTTYPENKLILKGTKRTMWPHNCAEIVGECFLSVSFLIAFFRILRYVVVIPEYGHIGIGLGRQMFDFVKTMLILLVVVIAFGSGLVGLYIPYKGLNGTDPDDQDRIKEQDDAFTNIWKALLALFWGIHGHSDKENVRLMTYKVNNSNGDGKPTDIHHTWTEWTGKILHLGFNFIGCMMLGSMLSGYFSQTMTQIEEDLDLHWKYARTEFYLSFVKDTKLPPPFNIIPTWHTLKRMGKWMCLCCKGDPMLKCSCTQCCYIDTHPKKEKWLKLMKGYRKLVLQLIFRYMRASNKAKGEEKATKDDVLELAEELGEIKAMLKKASKNMGMLESDDDDDDKPSPGGGGPGAGGSVYAASVKTTWENTTKSLLASSRSTKDEKRDEGADGGANGGVQMKAHSAPVVTQQPPKDKSKPGTSFSPSAGLSQGSGERGSSTPTRQQQRTATGPTPEKGTGVLHPTGLPNVQQNDHNDAASFGMSSSNDEGDDVKVQKIVEKEFKLLKAGRDTPPKQSTAGNNPRDYPVMRTTPTNAYNNPIDSGNGQHATGFGAIPSTKINQTLQNQSPGRTSNEYNQTRRGSRSGGGGPPEPKGFPATGDIKSSYKSPPKSATNIMNMAPTPKRSPGLQNSIGNSPDNNNQDSTSYSVRPSARTTTQTARLSSLQNVLDPTLFSKRNSGAMTDVFQTDTNLPSYSKLNNGSPMSAKVISGEIGTSEKTLNKFSGMNLPEPHSQWTSPSGDLAQFKFKAPRKSQEIVKNVYSPPKSPSMVPPPTNRTNTTPVPLPFSSDDGSGNATDGSSKANDYKNL